MTSSKMSRSITILEFILLLLLHADFVKSSSPTGSTESSPAVTSKAKPPCGVIQWSCPAVSIFNKCFMQNVLKSPTLSNAFDLTKLTQKEEADGLFYLVSILVQTKGDNRSPFVANLVGRDLAESKNPLTLQVMGSAYSNGVSKFLQYKGVLDQHNACSMANQYAATMAQSASRVSDTCIPNSKVSALAMGYEDYMVDMGLFEKENHLMMALFFGNEFLYQRDFQNPSPVYNAPIGEIPEESDTEMMNFPFREDLCDSSPPEVKAFNDVFQSIAHESPILRNLFDVNNVTVAEFARGTFHSYQYYLARARNQGAAQLAHFMSSSILGINYLTFELVMNAYSNIASKFLFSEKRLTVGNAQGLAKTYSKFLEDATVFIVDSSFINSKTIAMISGFVNYIKNLGLFTNLKGQKIAFHFANEWRCQAISQG